jgi:hypothetical protein
MPRGDGTGPQGQGAMTGRGRGKCNPKDRAYVSPDHGGMGLGRKLGRSRRQGPGRGVDRTAGRGAGQGRGRRS